MFTHSAQDIHCLLTELFTVPDKAFFILTYGNCNVFMRIKIIISILISVPDKAFFQLIVLFSCELK